MLNDQAILYSSLVFQWIVFAAILVAIGFIVNKKLTNIADKINKIASDVEKQIEDANKSIAQVEVDLKAASTQIEELDSTLVDGNITLEEVAKNIHEIILKLNSTVETVSKIKNNFLSKFKH